MAAIASCSIIIPCYNAGRFLADTLASVREQTCLPEETIVIDDGSTDGSSEIALRAGPNVKVIHQANQGESVARNVGLRAARGQHVLFLDADDLLAPETIERFEAAVGTVSNQVAVMGVASFTTAPEERFDRQMPTVSDFFPTIVQTNFGPPHCWYTPRALALAVHGFREDLVNSEDWDFWGRIALTGAGLVSVPYEGALYRRHANSQVATTPKPAIFRGRLSVAETLATGVLQDAALLERVGEPLFWSLWAMITQARHGGVAPPDLVRAEQLLQAVARRGPTPLRRTSSALAVRLLGVRAAERLRGLSAR